MEPLYDGKPLAYSQDIYSLTQSQADFIENKLTDLIREVEAFTKDALKSPERLALLGLPKDLDPTPTPLGIHIPFARFDCLFDGVDLKVLELNTDGTSGWNVVEWLNNKVKISDRENPNLWLSQRLLDGLRLHNPAATEIGLLDFHDVKTKWEQEDLVERWSQSTSPSGVTSLGGVMVNLAGPIAVKRVNPQFRGWKEGALIYRRALSWQLRAQPDLARSFLSDWNSKKITVVGGWSSDVGHSKVWPAFLKHPLTAETYLLADKNIDLAKDDPSQWLIKAALSFSGGGVFMGAELKKDQWHSVLDKALAETKRGRPWILQKKLKVPEWQGKPVELGVYFINLRPAGYLVRAGSRTFIGDHSDEKIHPIEIR